MAAAAQRQVEALGRGRQVGVQQLGNQARDVNRSIHLVAVALWLLAGLLLVVAVLVLGQLLARQIALDASDYPVLHSLGMTRRQLAGLAVARCTAIGAAGAALAVGVAIALSPLTPIGLARTAEPAPGSRTTRWFSSPPWRERPPSPPSWRPGHRGERHERLRRRSAAVAATG
jgi:hypothetical protein